MRQDPTHGLSECLTLLLQLRPQESHLTNIPRHSVRNMSHETNWKNVQGNFLNPSCSLVVMLVRTETIIVA